MTPDFVSEYAPFNGMVKACQRFIMALADVIFDATTRALSVYAIFMCSCLYHMSGSKRPIPLYPWKMTDLVCMGLPWNWWIKEQKRQNAITNGTPCFGFHMIGHFGTEL